MIPAIALDVAAYPPLLAARAESLSLVIVLGYALGALLAKGPFSAVLQWLRQQVIQLYTRLNKPNRGIATLVYRGMVAVIMLLIPTLVFAALLMQPQPWLKPVTALLGIAWFGLCFHTLPTYRIWRLAKAGKLPLELAGTDYLFADTHGVIRHLIRTRLDGFAIGVVGAGLWYVAGGVMAASIYLTLAAAATHFRAPVFGWAARSLFTLLDLLPHIVARVLLTLAALFANGARPLHALTARHWPLFVARLMDVSLGGHSPAGEALWVGDGTPKPTHVALRRLLTVTLAATVLLVLALNTTYIHNLLIKLI
jgi:cobalamin biosynthesis protein CobD/CbiB